MSVRSGSDAWSRLAVTAAAIALWRVATHLPVPGVDLRALSELYALGAGLPQLSQLSLVALGLGPFITASIAVEVLALFLNPLKAWRAGGEAGRLRLRRTAYQATLVFALLQGYGIATSLANITAPGGGPVTVFYGPLAKVVVAFTLAGGTFFLLALANLISRKGMGHGVSLLILCGLGWRICSGVFSAVRTFVAPDSLELVGRFGHFDQVLTVFGIAALVCVLIYLLSAVEQAALRIGVVFPEGVKASLPLRLMPAGIVPASWALSFVVIPFTVMQFTDLRLQNGLMDSLLPGGVLHETAGFVLIVFFSFFFTALFHRPPRIIADLEARGARLVIPPGEAAVKYLDRRLFLLALGGGLYLGLLVLAGNVAYHFSGSSPGAVSLLILVAIALDLYGEGRLRLHYGRLVSVAELHDAVRAALLEDLLRGRGVPCLLRGYRHRALLFFFGPYVEISLLVPEGHREEAEELVEHFLGA